MLSSKEISMLIEATGTSVYMTLASTLMAYVIGLPDRNFTGCMRTGRLEAQGCAV